MKMLVFDPGRNTGWSFWNDSSLISCGTATGIDLVLELMRELRNAEGLDFVLMEDFVGAAYTSDEKYTLEQIGAIVATCKLFGIKHERQAPAVRKGFIQFAKNVPGLQTVDSEVRRHAKDSIAHALRYFYVHKMWDINKEVKCKN